MQYIIITGAAGFIGSCMVGFLNQKKIQNIVIVDDFSRQDKHLNLQGKEIALQLDRNDFPLWLAENAEKVGSIIHLGARTDTTEQNKIIFDELNLHYSQKLWKVAANHQIPFIYASSAATYGAGELGYSDDHFLVPNLRPLNPYGDSKNEFDKWVLLQEETPPFWAGLKFFNVYGPNEYHKGRMASVIFHTHKQILETGKMNLFKSHRPDYLDGHQLRDFVYVKDVLKVIYFLMQNRPSSGIFNLGTGVARSFLDLATNTFVGMGLEPTIEFVDMPLDIRDTYQYFTEADMSKLNHTGYDTPFYSLEEGVNDYVTGYLMPHNYL